MAYDRFGNFHPDAAWRQTDDSDDADYTDVFDICAECGCSFIEDGFAICPECREPEPDAHLMDDYDTANGDSGVDAA